LQQTERHRKKLTTLRVSFAPTGTIHLLAFIALDQGYYAEEGLNVVSTPVNSGATIDTFTALLTGKLDLITGGSSMGNLLSIELDHPTVIIGGLLSGQGALMIRPGDEERWQQWDTANLAGRKIAVRRVQSSDTVLRGLMLEKGIDLTQIDFVEIDSYPTGIVATAKGEVDAVSVAHSSIYNAEKQGLKIFKYLGEEMVDLPCCRITASTELIKKYRNEYVGFLKSNIRAYKLFKTDNEKALEIAVKHLEMDEERIRRELFGYGYEYGYGNLNPDPGKHRMEELYDICTDIKYLNGGKDLDEHYDVSLYEDALNAILKEYPNDPFYEEMKQVFIRDNT
jgi:NitT/TauT family transport system substrate-binding protein